MSDSKNYDGNDLLQVFQDLNISLGNLNPNVVKALFDTDETDRINLLNFMCSSLSKENVLTPQEVETYKALETPLSDDEVKIATTQLEETFSGIFNYDLNSQKLKISLEELEQLKQEERRLDNLIGVNERLQHDLVHKKSKLEEETARINFRCEEVRKKCEGLSVLLDDKNKQIYDKLNNELCQLSNYIFSEKPEFLNRFNVEEFQDSVEFCDGIQDFVRRNHEDLSGNFSKSKINLNSTPNDDQPEDHLELLKNQIYSSNMTYLDTKMEEESLTEVLNYLDNFFIKDYLTNFNRSCISEDLQYSKVGQKKILHDMLAKKIMVAAEVPVNCVRIKKAENELQEMENKLVCLSQISKYYSKVLCTNSCVLMFFLQEKRFIENSDRLVRHISRYILNTLEDSKRRSDLMSGITECFKDFKMRPLDVQYQLLRSIMNLYGGNMLKEVFLMCTQLEKNSRMLERNYFENNSMELLDIVNNLFKNDAVYKFQYSGPTKQIVIIPSEIQKSLKNMRLNLDKQTSAIKFIVQITRHAMKKVNSDDCFKNFRLLWLYFLTSPKKMQELLHTMNEENETRLKKAIIFKN